MARRAQTLEMLPGGRVPHPNMRGFDLDSARILTHQGIRPGRSIEGAIGRHPRQPAGAGAGRDCDRIAVSPAIVARSVWPIQDAPDNRARRPAGQIR